ncbi:MULTISPECIES: 5-formyltetrahydrofolate cyclo-ligase [unclassified Sphingobacterium]|uniref:5-formyltetrahydrofolate cyclo-ligase n=1 Tax=unclassified Sphingobacterium TaxID=2609468 RepID=UPI0025FFEAB6|nr:MULTISPECIES: 5-formyltetrahydrofolate cyclo-ligase [unclassified Sphingobacterium]
MTKQELRQLYRLERKHLSVDELRAFNHQLLEHLKKMDWSKCQYCHVYLPISRNQEPDTLLFISWIQDTFPSIKLVISQSHAEDRSMSHYLLDNTTTYVENKWGIPEPVSGTPVDEKLLDMVLIPLLICDRTGNRVGYGKGFYDRFLKKCRPDVQKIGLSFFEPVEKITDVDPYDIALDCCITPQHIIYFESGR